MLSIVIPTRNRSTYLEQCLHAIHASIGGDIARVAVYVIDDGSCDTAHAANKSLCDRYGAHCHRQHRNRGMAVARATGAKKCVSEWIAFIDDDIVVDSAWYATLTRALAQCDRTVVGLEGSVRGSGPNIWDREVENRTGGLYLTCHIIYRRCALEDAGGFDEHFEFEGPFHEDHELAARMLQFGRISFAAEVAATHLPRTVALMPYVGYASRRMRQLLNAEIYFFLKQTDRYHLFRHASSFWGTYRAIALRHVYSTLHRRSMSVLLRHPIQSAALILACLIEQVTAWTMLPRLMARYLKETPPGLWPYIDSAASAAQWNLPDTALPSALRLHRPARKLVSFYLRRHPVYNAAHALHRLYRQRRTRPPLRFFLRIDDVFLSQHNQVEKLFTILGNAGVPYLAAITGDDLMSERAEDIVAQLRRSGGSIGMHGFSHIGHFGPYASEVLQLRLPELDKRIDRICTMKCASCPEPLAFVPPFNAVNALQIALLSKRFAVICGGPETARFTGRLMGPVVLHGGSRYFPSFYPFYAHSTTILSAVSQCGKWLAGDICLTVHMPQEYSDGFDSLQRLAEAIAAKTYSWNVLLAKGRGR